MSQSSRLPTPDSRLPTPDSRLPTPYSLWPLLFIIKHSACRVSACRVSAISQRPVATLLELRTAFE
ncbi:hypothetical protein [Moorena sp. SIO4G3]|uniref:hypothetical protein n=1 Tax=Moorena sp. SIO4G3 TaxID=2607821 RepID=UPI00142B8AC4|nr:hypothetical protein [Moorena sp. SIO4G3]NEO75556.1 hypothetical protein [Moorena sp. SIO4G3]